MAKKQAEPAAENENTEKKAIAKKVLPKKTFNLDAYKQEKNYNKVHYKPTEWLKVSQAFADATGVPGIPMGHITLIRGHSNTSKTTLLLEAAISAQQKGILPIFIISEMKWSWDHARMMGLEFDEETKQGNFIYIDRSSVKTIEDVAHEINKLLDDQETIDKETGKSKLPYDLAIFWDSVGSLPCAMSVEKQKNNNEWNAGAMSVQFGGHVNQRIIASRKQEHPYTNALICVNKVWVQKPGSPMEMPKMKNKGGETMFLDSSLIITCGGITSSGLNKIEAEKKGKKVNFASRVKLQVEKNHVNGVSTSARLIITPHGYIHDTKEDLDAYKKQHLDYLFGLLGAENDGEEIKTVISEQEEALSADGSIPDDGE